MGWLARADARIARMLPPELSPSEQYRARVLVALFVVFTLSMVATIPFDAANGAWVPVGIEVWWGSVVAFLLVKALRRGKIKAMGHLATGVAVINLAIMAQSKGGLLASEIAWECAIIVFATLVVGARGAFVWTLVAMAALAFHVHRYDPTNWHGPPASFDNPVAFGIDVALLYLAIWGLAYAFDRARAKFVSRLEGRNAEMRRVLDHVGDALLTIDVDGKLGAERSARADELLGAPSEGAYLWDVLAGDPANAERAIWLQMSWEGIVEDVLPREAALAQVPTRVTFRGRELDLRLTLIESKRALRGALVLLHDVTEELARERAERARREILAVFEHVRTDPGAVADFAQEMERLVESVRTGTEGAVVMRDVHTIKGSASLFGIDSIASLCHAIEDRCAHAELALPTAADRTSLARQWHDLAAELREWTGTLDGDRLVSIPRAELRDLRTAIADGRSPAAIAARLGGWELTPAERVLSRLTRQGRALAKKLEKEVDFRIEVSPPALRIDTQVLGPVIASLVHAVRNALDHGIAAPDVRASHGKERVGTIVLRATSDGASGLLSLEVVDDGDGIAWDAVRRKAIARGLPSSTDEELVAALMADGFSTRDEVTATSGRGVGLAGIRQAAVALGGSVVVESTLPVGSRIAVQIPLSATRGTSASLPAPRAVANAAA